MTYDKFLKRLGTEIPERAELRFSRLGDFGTPNAGDCFNFFAHLEDPSGEEPPDLLRLIAHHPLKKPDAEIPDETANRWADFASTFLAELNVPVLYGHVANDVHDTQGGTAFEEETPGLLEFSAFESGRLRGYSWVTVITASQARSLGGVASLGSSRAFSTVSETASGAVVLRATERLCDYTDEAVEKVWTALAPILPHGVVPSPQDPLSDGPLPRLILRDAAEA
ncbi:hypothetical protein [Nocardioides plantarum]|uniref:Uncharacterized protein n=1 Tax=Nocardioides plantarum TaxID=29299 RepID=A0ABV5KD86_9ACTN|nr:hypothetical protein [Nocardioides plantarum]